MQEYFIHWWNGDLASNYHPFSFTIAQINKIFKIGLYVTALLTIFDLFAFTAVMGTLGKVSYVSICSYRFVLILFNILNLILRFILGVLLVILGKRILKLVFKSTFQDYFENTKSAADDHAKSHLIVQVFDWLEQHPVSERGIKIINFILLLIFSLCELLSS
jgi:hypothetical protein